MLRQAGVLVRRAWDWAQRPRIVKNRAVIGLAIITLGMFVAVSLAGVAVNDVNQKDNATRCSVVGLVVQLTENSRRAAEATIASKTASPAQKHAAAKNLEDIAATAGLTREVLHHPHGTACNG